jgi:hypothetical protein
MPLISTSDGKRRALAGYTTGAGLTFRSADVLDMTDFGLVAQFFEDRDHLG